MEIAKQANAEGDCVDEKLGHQRLALKANITIRQVRRVVKKLIDMGELEVISGIGRTVSQYRLPRVTLDIVYDKVGRPQFVGQDIHVLSQKSVQNVLSDRTSMS
jgi:hypothetical protein